MIPKFPSFSPLPNNPQSLNLKLSSRYRKFTQIATMRGKDANAYSRWVQRMAYSKYVDFDILDFTDRRISIAENGEEADTEHHLYMPGVTSKVCHDFVHDSIRYLYEEQNVKFRIGMPGGRKKGRKKDRNKEGKADSKNKEAKADNKYPDSEYPDSKYPRQDGALILRDHIIVHGSNIRQITEGGDFWSMSGKDLRSFLRYLRIVSVHIPRIRGSFDEVIQLEVMLGHLNIPFFVYAGGR
jgi:hypothetical protein